MHESGTRLVGVAWVLSALVVACAAGDDEGAGGASATTTSTSAGGSTGAGGAGAASGGGTGGGGGASAGGGGTSAGGGGVGGGAGGAGGAGCVIASYSFDDCADGWTSGGRNSDWACGNVTSGPLADHTGDHFAWGTNLSGDAATCQSSWIASPTLDLSAYAGKAVRLSFWHWYDFRECTCGSACVATPNESDSGGMIEVDSGSGFALVAPIGGYEHGGYEVNCAAPGYCGESACALDGEMSAFTAAGLEQVWHESTVDISSHATAAFQVRLLFGSHAPFSCFPNRAGWYVDDVLIYTEEPCP